MGTVLATVIGAAVTLIGLVIVQWNTRWIESTKWNRTHSVRWDVVRHNAYAEFAAAVKSEVRVHLLIAAGRWPQMWPDHATIDAEAGRAKLEDLEMERMRLFESVILLGDPAVVSAARTWAWEVWNLRQTFSASYEGGGEGFIELYNRTGRARDAFYSAARADLQVPGELNAVPAITYGLPTSGFIHQAIAEPS
ncbi:hypothetical protein [Nocardia cyriacigeorgica]|uniref:hypothetical protein n=1 Tax=Nocardia cyriacigeorgica TaxID=135487 RepID=UPI000CE9B9A8|nr:hypothetical protein [Nocardia cyriacigeorgica]MBF6323850.1 hypothetical protein [Nocardia cyriacigeorgica]PPJ16170.1 hypothetical protein C5E43_03885 [Nocardia cyriacigeorgica]